MLQFRVLAGVRQVEGVGDGRHRLKADEIAPRRRVDHGHRIPRAIGNGETAAGRFHPKAGAAIGIADQVAEDVIERPERERMWVGEIAACRAALAGRNQQVAQSQVIARGQMYAPVIARRAGQAEIRVVADGHGHRLGRMVFETGLHFQLATSQPVRHGDGMREGELRHERRMRGEFQAARSPGAVGIAPR